MLDDLASAHRVIGGTGRGRRWATAHINQAYVMALSSQFQGFCRELHTECADYFSISVPAPVQPVLRRLLQENRKLDKGNPNPGNIGSDFGRFGLVFWDQIKEMDVRNQRRIRYLEQLNDWRNAIGHQDFNPDVLGTSKQSPTLVQIRQWRSACMELSQMFDKVMLDHLAALIGSPPW